MRITGMLTGMKAADYLDQRLQDLRDQLTDDELKRAMVPVWLIKIIEPGADEAYTCRIDAEDAPKDTDLDGLLFGREKRLRPAGHSAFVELLITPIMVVGASLFSAVAAYIQGENFIVAGVLPVVSERGDPLGQCRGRAAGHHHHHEFRHRHPSPNGNDPQRRGKNLPPVATTEETTKLLLLRAVA